jgi:hypothetical protein
MKNAKPRQQPDINRTHYRPRILRDDTDGYIIGSITISKEVPPRRLPQMPKSAQGRREGEGIGELA